MIKKDVKTQEYYSILWLMLKNRRLFAAAVNDYLRLIVTIRILVIAVGRIKSHWKIIAIKYL